MSGVDYMLRMLRREDRTVMSGRCTISRGTWPDQEDVDTDVRCLIRPSQRVRGDVSSGGEQVALHIYDVRLPWEQDVRRGDVITATASRDPLIVGRSLVVTEVTADEWAATRMAVCEESVR